MTLIDTILLLAAVAGWAAAFWLRAQRSEARSRHAAELAAMRQQHATQIGAEVERTWALLDRMVEGVIVVDQHRRIRFANRAAATFFGFTRPVENRTVLETTRHHELAALVARLQREPEVLNHEVRIEGLTATRCLEVNALALHNRDGAPDGALFVFHDLTRLRQLESQRQEFVANVSHELRTPLSLIKSAAETLLDGGKDDPAVAVRFLEIIDKHANRLTRLIDDLLLLGRLDSGRVELRLQPVGLRAAAQEVLDDAAALASARGVTLRNQVPPGLAIEADPERLRQVLANLVDNAIKYGRPEGSVMLSGVALPAGGVELSVRDDGPGIPAEAKARIFERFYRVDKARSREEGGTGLGLAIVKNVVQAHGGDVRVESAPGQGTEFFITLPATRGSGVERPAAGC